jgi:hypothetical protein
MEYQRFQNKKIQNGISGYSKVEYNIMDTYQFLFCMSFYCRDDDWSDDESDADWDSMHKHEEYSHSEIKHQCNFGFRHLINAHLSSEMSPQYQADSNTHGTAPHCLNSNDIDSDHGTDETIKTFPTMLKGKTLHIPSFSKTRSPWTVCTFCVIPEQGKCIKIFLFVPMRSMK